MKKLVPSLSSEHAERDRVWCLHGIQFGDKVYLFYIMVRMHERLTSPDDVGFEIVGSGLAVGNDRAWDFRRLEHDGETLWWNADQPQFAAAVHYDPRTDYADRDLIQHAYLARVRPVEIEILSRYEYFAGDADRWSRDVRQAAPLFSGQPNEMSVSHNKYLDCYLAIHSMGLSSDIVAHRAEYLWGPWSEPITLWSAPLSSTDDLPPPSFYAGKEHPELAEDNGRVLYVTYVESNEYFPRLVEIALQ